MMKLLVAVVIFSSILAISATTGYPCSNCGGSNVQDYMCSVFSCDAGFADCDANPSTGCEVNTNTDTSNCGGCTNACSASHASTYSCSAGSCSVSSCSAGFGDCDSSYANGCEVNTNTDTSNCGSCSNACSYANAAPACSGGACSMGACNAGFADCDSSSANGCEVNLNTVQYCGTCSGTCPAGSQVYTAGCNTDSFSCQNQRCNYAYFDCDGVFSNGCETFFLAGSYPHTVIFEDTAPIAGWTGSLVGSASFTASFHHTGTVSASFTPMVGNAIVFMCNTAGCIDTSVYPSIGFFSAGGKSSGSLQSVNFNLYKGGSIVWTQQLSPQDFLTNVWTRAYLPLVTSSVAATTYDGFSFSSSSTSSQLPVYLDQINLVKLAVCPSAA